MGCGNSVEDQVLLAKLDRLEVQVKKEKELKKLSELEGRPITSLNQYNGFDTRTETRRRMKTAPDDRNMDTYTNKDRTKKKKKKGNSEKKSKSKKKDKEEKSKKKSRAVSDGGKKKEKKEEIKVFLFV